MALPLSRDITLAPGTQIPSSLLNNLQDMIIGGRHGELEIVIPPCDMLTAFDSAGNEARFAGNAYWRYGTASESVWAPLRFPVGTIVNEAIFYGEHIAGTAPVLRCAAETIDLTDGTPLLVTGTAVKDATTTVPVEWTVTFNSSDAGWPFTLTNDKAFMLTAKANSGTFGETNVYGIKIKIQK